MRGDQIISERDFYSNAPGEYFGRAWVKRDLEFWHRCTVEEYGEKAITVSLDNCDELTVAYDQVQLFQLERGDLVFVELWEDAISGHVATVIEVTREVVDVEFPESLYGKAERQTRFLREIRLYGELEVTYWKRGARVFAYKAVQYEPPIFLLFAATVQKVHFGVCVEVEFDDGGSAIVPLTLVEKIELKPGDLVHTCTSYLATARYANERWGACNVIRREGDSLLLQDENGARFESKISLVGILPTGYQMNDGTLAKISTASANDAAPQAPKTYHVHIVRTELWSNAAQDPIAKNHVDGLIASDPELAWQPGEKVAMVNMSLDDRVDTRTISIVWKEQPCFEWHGNEIRCVNPTAVQLAKMIAMAIELDANVIGDDGREYH